MGNGIGETRALADLRDESPLELQVGLRLARIGSEYILQVLAFKGPRQGYEWTNIPTYDVN